MSFQFAEETELHMLLHYPIEVEIWEGYDSDEYFLGEKFPPIEC